MLGLKSNHVSKVAPGCHSTLTPLMIYHPLQLHFARSPELDINCKMKIHLLLLFNHELCSYSQCVKRNSIWILICDRTWKSIIILEKRTVVFQRNVLDWFTFALQWICTIPVTSRMHDRSYGILWYISFVFFIEIMLYVVRHWMSGFFMI